MDGFLYDLSVEQSQSNNQDFTLQEWKWSIFIPIPKKGNAKECANYCTIGSFHRLARLYTKSFKIGFNSTWTENFQMYKLDSEKAEETSIKLPTSVGL